jgi:hypothetical protein
MSDYSPGSFLTANIKQPVKSKTYHLAFPESNASILQFKQHLLIMGFKFLFI